MHTQWLTAPAHMSSYELMIGISWRSYEPHMIARWHFERWAHMRFELIMSMTLIWSLLMMSMTLIWAHDDDQLTFIWALIWLRADILNAELIWGFSMSFVYCDHDEYDTHMIWAHGDYDAHMSSSWGSTDTHTIARWRHMRFPYDHSDSPEYTFEVLYY